MVNVIFENPTIDSQSPCEWNIQLQNAMKWKQKLVVVLLACTMILFLLFYVITIPDDIHTETLMVEMAHDTYTSANPKLMYNGRRIQQIGKDMVKQQSVEKLKFIDDENENDLASSYLSTSERSVDIMSAKTPTEMPSLFQIPEKTPTDTETFTSTNNDKNSYLINPGSPRITEVLNSTDTVNVTSNALMQSEKQKRKRISAETYRRITALQSTNITDKNTNLKYLYYGKDDVNGDDKRSEVHQVKFQIQTLHVNTTKRLVYVTSGRYATADDIPMTWVREVNCRKIFEGDVTELKLAKCFNHKKDKHYFKDEKLIHMASRNCAKFLKHRKYVIYIYICCCIR